MMKNNFKNEDVILSLDLASQKTGFAIYKDGEIITYGTWHLKQDANHKSKRYADLYAKISNAIETYGITHIVMEDIHEPKDRKYLSACVVLGECHGVAKLAIAKAKHDIALTYYDTDAISICLLRNRYIRREEKKAQTIQYIQSLGYSITDKEDDTADAIALLILHALKRRLPIKY
jgi:Holliday junction resolvasome RuvABC endonuclease subunit